MKYEQTLPIYLYLYHIDVLFALFTVQNQCTQDHDLHYIYNYEKINYCKKDMYFSYTD